MPGQLGFPGGHMEFGESHLQCAEREALEETGLRVKAGRVFAVTNSVLGPEHQYITLFVKCTQEDPSQRAQVSRTGRTCQQPTPYTLTLIQLLEPEKCEGWIPMSWAQLKSTFTRNREELFLPIVNLL